MKFPQPSEYYLPSLKFLQKKRLVVTALYVSIYYILFITFAASVITTYIKSANTQYPDSFFSFFFVLLILSGVGVLLHLRRLTLAIRTKRQALQDGTTIPHYDIALSPVEASVLIDARDAGEMALLVIIALQSKSNLRAWRNDHDKIQLQYLDSGAALTYYEQAFMTALFAKTSSVTLSDRQLRRHNALNIMQNVIYEQLVAQGYLAKMNRAQQALYQYGLFNTVVFGYISYGLVVLIMSGLAIGTLHYGPLEVLPHTSPQQVALVLAWSAVLIVAPLLLLTFSAYSKRGSASFRTVYGFYWFLKVAFASRLSDKQFLSKAEREKYLPYAIAFGIPVDQ